MNVKPSLSKIAISLLCKAIQGRDKFQVDWFLFLSPHIVDEDYILTFWISLDTIIEFKHTTDY